MSKIGTPLTKNATRVLLLGAGELGKALAIEFQRLGVEVIACDRYEHAPAMQVAHRSHVLSMLDAKSLESIIRLEEPDFIVPEIEAIATDVLMSLEQEGFTVVPTARAAHLTMNREGIRLLAAKELGLPTTGFAFAQSFESFVEAVDQIGLPCVVKPIMSSSGKGQSVIREEKDIESAWQFAQEGGRASKSQADEKVIVEAFLEFDYEITLLTVRHINGTVFCPPIGHRQEDGDYQESWQPHPMSDSALSKACEIAKKVTDALGGRGIFGVELFVAKDEVYFSEVSPRPHDTGLVTLVSQELSEFALHARAILGLPIPDIGFLGPSASAALLVSGSSRAVRYEGLAEALEEPGTQLQLFGKPEVEGKRRMGVVLAKAPEVDAAVLKAKKALNKVKAFCE